MIPERIKREGLPAPMPFTPFHLGPAVMLKAAVPAEFSAAAFVGTQVAVDSEFLCHLLRRQSCLRGVLPSAVCAADPQMYDEEFLAATIFGVGGFGDLRAPSSHLDLKS